MRIELDQAPAVTSQARLRPRPVLSCAEDVAWAAAALASGAVVGAAFANFYALTARPDEATVRRVNLMKGRPPSQVGSITAPPSAIPDVWDYRQLPAGLTRRSILEVVDTFFRLGPFGFQGPARADIPAHLRVRDGGMDTVQVIAPGYSCRSNYFLNRALRATDEDFLYITSANRSRHVTGAEDSPAHWRAPGLRAEFGDRPGFVVLEHDDEDAARLRYPGYQPMSTTVLALHKTTYLSSDRRPHLTLDRAGSLSTDVVRAVLADLGFGLVIGPRALRRMEPRVYAAA